MRVQSEFQRAWWLPGAHLQTLFPHIFRAKHLPALMRQRLELDDGDFLDMDRTVPLTGPLVLLLHGLEGSSRSHYVAGLMNSFYKHNFEVCLLYFRGCSGEPNRLPRSYHSGETTDLENVLRHLKEEDQARVIYVVGVSLGGNVLLKWLGENPDQDIVQRAVAVSVPFQLNNAAVRLQKGFSRLYQYYLLRRLRRSTRIKAARMKLPVETRFLSRLTSFRAFDDHVTAPLHGFKDVDDYYSQSSSGFFIGRIRTPTLVIHALDDPFMTACAIPDDGDLGPGVRLEISGTGGHAGFVSGVLPWRPRYWLDERILRWLNAT